MKNAIVLAAGKGTRMKSDKPKVLHKICGMPMVQMIVENLKEAGTDRIVTVTGYGHEQVEEVLQGQCEFALQEPQLGTGHAVMMAKQLENEKGKTLVVNGDAATIQKETLESLYDALEGNDMAVLCTSLEDARAYGRVIRDENGNVVKIVEFKDATDAEKAVHEINTGIYAFDNEKLFKALKELKNDNVQHEYYITDLVEIFRSHGWSVKGVLAKDPMEVQGCNDNAELAISNAWLRDKINEKLMKNGVTMVDPKTTYVGPFVTFGHDVVLHQCVSVYGHSHIGNNVEILPGACLMDEEVPDNTVVRK